MATLPDNLNEAAAIQIIARLQSAGHVAYLAGGCVRDRLMDRPPKDFDIATSANPQQVLQLFPHSQQVGIAFGVVLVRWGKNQPIEVATFRSDGAYRDGRHPEHVSFTDARHDAQRRDFTCNGLFFDPRANSGNGQLHDYVGGQQDITNKILRAIGEPALRFAEDHLRMLRAVRLAARLGFTIEGQTWNAMRQLAGHIKGISTERVSEELALILTHPSRPAAMNLLQGCGLLQIIWPGRLFPQPDLLRPWEQLELLAEDCTFGGALAAVQLLLWQFDGQTLSPANAANGTSEAPAELEIHLTLSNKTIGCMAWVFNHVNDIFHWQTLGTSQFKRLLADANWRDLEAIRGMWPWKPGEAEAFQTHVKTLRDQGVSPPPFITGIDLIAMGVSPGPAFKRWLEELYDRQLENAFAGREDALAAARQKIKAPQ